MEGLRWAEANLFPKRSYTDPQTGDSETKAGIMRLFHGRSNPHDDALLMPEDVASVSRASPAPKIDGDAWAARHLREVALVFMLPISFVESSFIGQTSGSAATSTGRGSRLGVGENRGIEAQADKAFKAERQAFTRFFAWIYTRSLAGFELLDLNKWVDRVTVEEQQRLGQLLGGPRGTRSERRARLGEMLAPPPRKKRRRAREEEEDPSDTEEGTGLSAADLRSLIAERLQAQDYLPASVHFQVPPPKFPCITAVLPDRRHGARGAHRRLRHAPAGVQGRPARARAGHGRVHAGRRRVRRQHAQGVRPPARHQSQGRNGRGDGAQDPAQAAARRCGEEVDE